MPLIFWLIFGVGLSTIAVVAVLVVLGAVLWLGGRPLVRKSEPPRIGLGVALALVLAASPIAVATAQQGASAPPVAEAQVSPKLDDAEAYHLRLIRAEQQVIQERLGRLQAVTDTVNMSVTLLQRDARDKAAEYTQAVEAAAKKAGLDLKDGWQPDPMAKTWNKR